MTHTYFSPLLLLKYSVHQEAPLESNIARIIVISLFLRRACFIEKSDLT